MSDSLRNIWRGMGYVERYGHHPGTLPLVGLVLLGALNGGFVGAGLMLVAFCPLYLVGAHERGKPARLKSHPSADQVSVNKREVL